MKLANVDAVVGLIGKARTGKTTVSTYLQQKYGFTELSFADPLKEMCIAALVSHPPPDYCWHSPEGDHEESHWRRQIYKDRTPFTRWLLQWIGTDIFRNQVDPDFWIKLWIRTFHEKVMRMHPARIVIPDLRFPNEAKAIRDVGGKLWRIVRPELEATIAHGAAHASETEAEGIASDVTLIVPEGLDNLYRAIDDEMAGRFKKEQP